MFAENPRSEFASPKLAQAAKLESQLGVFAEHPLVSVLLTCLDGVVVLLNENRQLIGFNEGPLRDLGISGPASVVGKRMGQILGCVREPGTPSGCGTGRSCRTCGMAVAIVTSQETNTPCEADCLLTTSDGSASVERQFRVRASPLKLGDHDFTVVSLQDISAEKERQLIQGVFLHDLGNLLQVMQYGADLLREPDSDPVGALEKVTHTSEMLVGLLQSHRELHSLSLAKHDLPMQSLDLCEYLPSLVATFQGHQAAKGRHLVLLPALAGLSLTTNESLLGRGLGNMIVNALEASPAGAAVTVRARREPTANRVRIDVHNVGAIPPSVVDRVYQPHFTTKKGKGRGLGAYGTRMIVEQLLGGKVGFTSTPVAGTRFFIDLPADSPGVPSLG